jgi:hypothetical protein
MIRSAIFRTLALGIIAATLGAGPAAQASIPGPDGVIHGCYTSGPGVTDPLAVLDSLATCPSGVALNWNQTGPQGPQGPQGPPGPPTLPDAVQQQGLSVNGQYFSAPPNGINNRVIPLPVGNWAVTIHLLLFDGPGICVLQQLPRQPDEVGDSMQFVDSDYPGGSNVTLTTTVHETTGSELNLECVSHGDVALEVQGNMVAIQVGSVTVRKNLVDPNHATIDHSKSFVHLDLSSATHARLVKTYYSPTASSHDRQVAQIALMLEQGRSLPAVRRDTFATAAQVRAVLRTYRGTLSKPVTPDA